MPSTQVISQINMTNDHPVVVGKIAYNVDIDGNYTGTLQKFVVLNNVYTPVGAPIILDWGTVPNNMNAATQPVLQAAFGTL